MICKETLANQIYGPSYLSFEYALSYYGMIPERVEVLTSATTGVNKKFNSPIGTFLYRHLPQKKYPIGVTLIKLDDYHSALFATPEKALLDQIYVAKGLSQNSLRQYLLEDLRIDEEKLTSLSLSTLNAIATIYSNTKVTQAVQVIKEWQI